MYYIFMDFFKNKIKINLKVQLLIAISVLILVFHIFLDGWRPLGREYSIFYLDEEYTIGVLFTSAVAIFVGIEFITYSFLKDIRQNILLLISGFFFLALALDEFFSIHESFNTYLGETLTGIQVISDTTSFSWVFSLGIIVLLVILLLARLVISERDKTIQASYIIGLSLFVSVLGLELIGGRLFGQEIYRFVIGLEEFFEMLGIIFFYNAIVLKDEKER